MKPPPFEYERPTSLSEAIDALRRYGGEAKILAGGQSLVPLLNMRLVRPGALVPRATRNHRGLGAGPPPARGGWRPAARLSSRILPGTRRPDGIRRPRLGRLS